MIRKTLTAVTALAFAMSTVPAAHADIKFANGALTGNVGITSDYIFRGISNSDEHPAVQGGLDYNHNSGFYVGTWASSVDFDDNDNASMEWDLYGGYAKTWNGVTLNGKFIYYVYPGVGDHLSDDYNYWELQGSAAYTLAGVGLSAGFAYSPDFFFASGDSLYLQAAASIPFLQYFAVETHIGHQSIDKNARFGAPSYYDWSIGVSGTYQGLKLGVYYVDTNISRGECFPGTNAQHWCDGRAIATLTYTF